MRKIDGGDGRQITGTLTINLWSDGALSVEGLIGDKAFAEAILLNALDALRNSRRPKDEIVIPNQDVSVPQPIHPLVHTAGR